MAPALRSLIGRVGLSSTAARSASALTSPISKLIMVRVNPSSTSYVAIADPCTNRRA